MSTNNKLPVIGGLLLVDIKVEPFARDHPLKQRSYLRRRGRLGESPQVPPQHYPRLQPRPHRSQGLRPGHRLGSPFFPSPPDRRRDRPPSSRPARRWASRSEEHTSELQSRQYLVCRLLLEKKKSISRDARGTLLTF